jgi:uncharacterized protein (DUF4415 family)
MSKSKTLVSEKRSGNSNTPAILTDEHPELDINYVVKKVVRMGLKPSPGKISVALLIDQDVLAWFKSQGDGCQKRINSLLREFRDASVGATTSDNPDLPIDFVKDLMLAKAEDKSLATPFVPLPKR